MKRTILLYLVIAAPALAQDDGLALWERIYEVFSHPRCVNCHVPADNRPRWSGPGYGEARAHGMNIDAGPDRIGAMTLVCNTCHTQQNSSLPHGPPGAFIWALAPVQMDWWEKSSAYICAQIKDPARNGGRDLEGIASHLEHDALVRWGWEPGPGREPAPYSVEEVAGFVRAWAEAGAACPE